jgi:hypothetical protein
VSHDDEPDYAAIASAEDLARAQTCPKVHRFMQLAEAYYATHPEVDPVQGSRDCRGDRIDQALGYLRVACQEARNSGVSVDEFDERVSDAARLIAGE